jgi:hypothetical protein
VSASTVGHSPGSQFGRSLALTPDRTATLIIFIALFIAVLAQQAGSFQYDAQHYWDATRSLVGVGSTPDGFWELRGILSAVVFLPAAVASTFLSAGHDTLPVLAQNALVIAAAGAFLFPWVLREWVATSLPVKVLTAALLWFATTHFAPFALVDLYPAFALIATIPLLNRSRWWSLAIAGALIGVALNLRPAYIIVAVLLLAVALIRHRWLGLVLLAGVFAAILPQIVLNLAMFGVLSPSPIGSGDLAQLQAGYASYTVRYDTVMGDANARQFYCSPWMATAVESIPISSLGDLAKTMLITLPGSALFALQKIGASVFWPLTTPYSTPTPGIDIIVGLVFTALTVVGISAIWRTSLRIRGQRKPEQLGASLATVAIVIGTFLAIVASASEARFALAAVLLGVLGVASLAASHDTHGRGNARWLGMTVAVLLGVIALGATGLDHPAPRGEATVGICASTP